MAQVFARVTKAEGRWKPGELRWVGVPQLHLAKGIEPVDPESPEAKAEVEDVMGNVPGIALASIEGAPSDQFAITNPFRIDREKRHLLRPDPSMASARSVRWNFRERIMDIWKGRNGFKMPERKTVLRDFLKYHWAHGGNRTALFDYLGSMPDEQWHPDEIPGYIMLHRPTYTAPEIEKALAEEIRAWIDAAQAGAKAFTEIGELLPSLQGRLNLRHEQAGGTIHPFVPVHNPDPHFYPKSMGIDPIARAKELHEEQLRDFIPGLSICPFPRYLSIGTHESNTGVFPRIELGVGIIRAGEPWVEIDRVVMKQVDKLPEGPLKDSLRHWTYSSIAPGTKPNAYDISNPRAYLLDGTHLPNDHYWNAVNLEFQHTLRAIWTDPYKYPPNRKAEILVEYLDHHFDKGGNPKALLGYLERIGPSVNKNTSTGIRTPLFPDGLQKALAAWIVIARKRIGNGAKSIAKAKAWPDLKSLALFHAFRCEAGEGSAEITKENASEIANGAGFTKQSSGKELKGHFTKYAWGTPESKRCERTKEGKRTGDVLKRFDTVIAKLAPHAKALALAEEERKIVRNRSNTIED